MKYLNNICKIFWRQSLRLGISVIILFITTNLVFSQSSNVIKYLEECSQLGENSEDVTNYLFGNIKSIDVDSKGNVYILDGKGTCIKKYSKSGKFIVEISREGEGPGGLLAGRILRVDKNDNVYIYDIKSKRLSLFDFNGDYISSLRLDRQVLDFQPVLNNKLLVHSASLRDKEGKVVQVQKISLRSPNSSEAIVIDSLIIDNVTVIKNGSQQLSANGPFQESLVWDLDSKSNIIVVDPFKYVIKKYNLEGNILETTKFDVEKEIVTEKDKVLYFENIEVDEPMLGIIKKNTVFPNFMPYVSDIIIDKYNNIYLKKYSNKSDETLFYVFDNKIQFISNLQLPGEINYAKCVISSDKFYCVTKDTEGFPTVSICKLRY